VSNLPAPLDITGTPPIPLVKGRDDIGTPKAWSPAVAQRSPTRTTGSATASSATASRARIC
jgi:hypothetical protein